MIIKERKTVLIEVKGNYLEKVDLIKRLEEIPQNADHCKSYLKETNTTQLIFSWFEEKEYFE